MNDTLGIAAILAVVGLLCLVLASGVWDTVGIVLLVLAAVGMVLGLVRRSPL